MKKFFTSPAWLPQVNAPYEYVVGGLQKDGIEYEESEVHPTELKPLQGIVSYEKIGEMGDELDPIWLSMNNEILDGHHRYGKALTLDKPIKSIKIKLNYKDAARVLNKIQDIYDYENNEELEEVVAQDILNMKNDPNIDDEKGQKLLSDNKGKKVRLEAYRKNKVVENSPTGNFFSPKQRDGYKKYVIEFDNLLDVSDLGIDKFERGELPTYKVLKVIIPNVNVNYPFDKQAAINKAVASVLKKMGYDGVKYGDMMIQSF
ncbi:MAG: hypothetical protein ACOCVF_01335 [bacterium]